MIDSKNIPEEAHVLIRNLEGRRGFLAKLSKSDPDNFPSIKIKDTFVRYLDWTYRGRDQKEIRDINRRVFALMNRVATLANGSQDTAAVTSMYAHQQSGARSIDELPYSEFLKEVKNIIALCEKYRIKFKSVTSMQARLGMPKVKDLDALLMWCKDNEVDLKSVTGMQNGLGIPKTADLDALLMWCKDNEVDLKSVTGMQNGLGIPKTEDLDALLTWRKENK